MKIAYYGKNDQETYYVNSIKHGFTACSSFESMINEVQNLKNNGFLLALENRQNLTMREIVEISARL